MATSARDRWSLGAAGAQISKSSAIDFSMTPRTKVSPEVVVASAALTRQLDKTLTLKAPLPNLFRATFEQASHHSVGEHWLQHRIAVFDTGGKQVRKHVLQEFLEYIGQMHPSSLEELFSNQAHLFFIRLTSWFSVTLPICYELPLQLKVFLTFLEFREQAFTRAFFECGTVMPLISALSTDFDASDEVRCMVIMVLHKLAANGRQQKELLCENGIVPYIMDCVSDGIRWEVLKFAGRLLRELLQQNPRFQAEVLDALQDFLVQRLPLTQRVGTQVFISLLAWEGHVIPPVLREPDRHRLLAQRALQLLDSSDLRVGADAYCLLCNIVRSFGCDEFLFEFARTQLLIEKGNWDAWLSLEEGPAVQEFPTGGRHKGTVSRIHQCVAAALASEGGSPPEGAGFGAELVLRVNRSNVEFCEAFRAEAGFILKWGVVFYLSKRNERFRDELVRGGLTETLLIYLLDIVHPVRQGAALAELHRLRLLAPRTQRTIVEVLGKRELVDAMSLDQFMALAAPSDLRQARYRLRNLVEQGQSNCHSAEEFRILHQSTNKEIEATTAHGHGQQASASSGAAGAFLTEPPTASSAAGPPPGSPRALRRETTALSVVSGGGGAKQEQQLDIESGRGVGEAGDEAKAAVTDEDLAVPRSGSERYHIRRVVPSRAGAGPGGTSAGYKLDRAAMEDIPFNSALSSFVFDPLDSMADEASPLVQELRSIESVVGLGGLGSAPAQATGAASPPRGPAAIKEATLPLATEVKASHRPTLEHARAMALRPLGPRRLRQQVPEAAPPPRLWRRSSDEAPSRADSEATELSLRTEMVASTDGDPSHAWLYGGLSTPAVHGCGCSCRGCRGGASTKTSVVGDLPRLDSLVETSVGPEPSGASLKELSQELASVGESFRAGPSVDFTAGPSVDFTAGPSVDEPFSLLGAPSVLTSATEAMASANVVSKTEVGKTAVVRAVIEEQRPPDYSSSSSLALPRAAVSKKCILHVAPAPYHQCVAFDRSNSEQERAKSAELLSGMLHPETFRRVGLIQAAGSFPRKMLFRDREDSHHPSRAAEPQSARPFRSVRETPPVVRADSRWDRPEDEASARAPPPAPELEGPDPAPPFRLQQRGAASRWIKLDDAEGGNGAKHFFPASANAFPEY
jgi:hypothetical protein